MRAAVLVAAGAAVALLAAPAAAASTESVVFIGGTGTGMVPASSTVPQGFVSPFVSDVGAAVSLRYDGAPWARPQAAVPAAHAAVEQQAGPVTVIGLSKGAQVARAAEARDTRTDTRYVFIGDPDDDHGVSRAMGFSAPKRVFTHDVNLVTAEYDAVGDFPDRPNALSVLNAMAGWQQLHTQYGTGKASDPLTHIAEAKVTTSTNPNGTTTTRTLIPTKHLPITQGIRNTMKAFGHTTADKVVDRIDARLRPTIDAGYSRNAKPAKPPKAAKPSKAAKAK